ncbi:hypothetical protein PVAND_015733 [Polypedilum vanderplanki]|uniref:Centrosomin N-terminal motif 1 domain-containing protein n=1 Tax=Polypedilum vanderplanki TaxID=319348 RepID=A0A9J6BE18_POLVA|nr:hypothetical protein PVAND_015733 [Polypedilum vanderplanki]
MSGIFKFNTDGSGGSGNSDKNTLNPKPSFSGPASLSTPTRALNRVGLFMGSHDGEMSLNASSHQAQQQRTFTNCPSSPAQGRSLREFEDQLAALRKENFNLKLRIYFLEEKPASSTPKTNTMLNSSIETINKENIDLKVENESLRKEVEEKQELLCQASKAMEMMENQHKKESNEAQMIVDDLNHKIEAMTHEIKTLEKALIESSRNNDTGFSDFLGAIDSKDIDAQRKIAEFELIVRSFSDQNEQLCQKIEQMETERGEMTRKINQLNYENAELKEKLEELEKFSDKDGMKKLQDECYESKRRLADAISHFDELETKLKEKTEAHAKCLQIIQNACQHIEDLELHVEQLKTSQPNSLSSTESAKNDDNFSHANLVILKLRQQIEQITNEKNEEICQLKEELSKRSKMSFTPLFSSSILNSSQPINFPINELSFNDVIEKNRSAQKKIHFLKQRLSSNDTNKIENELLQLQLKEAQNEVYDTENTLRQSVTFCGVLLERLEELIKFLSSLLQNKDITGLLGHEIQKAITRAVDRNPNLAISLNNSFTQNLSEMSMIDFVESFASSTVGESLVDSLENFSFKTDGNKMMASNSSNKGKKNMRRSLILQKHQSEQESEEWSEPDRDCSRERIGLSAAEIKKRTPTTSDEEDLCDFQGFINTGEHRLVKKTEWTLIHEKIKSLESLLQEKNDKILEISSMLLDSENETKMKILQIRKKLEETESDLQHYKNLYHQVTTEKCEILKTLNEKENSLEQTRKEKDKINAEHKALMTKFESQKSKLHEEENKLQSLKVEYELKCTTYDQLLSVSEKRESAFKDELQQNWVRKTVYNQLLYDLERKQARLKDYQQKFSSLEGEMKIMQAQIIESDEKLDKITKNLDTATLQLSAASLERSKALNEKRSLEMKLKKSNEDFQKLNIERQELNLKIADLEVFNAKLQNRLLIGDKGAAHLSDVSGYMSEDAHAPRSLSFSSTEDREIDTASDCASCKKLVNEMNEIKKNLNLSKRSLEIAYTKLRNQNLRKAQIEMDIKQQIVKTQTVLQNVKANMDVELSRTSGVEKKN